MDRHEVEGKSLVPGQGLPKVPEESQEITLTHIIETKTLIARSRKTAGDAEHNAVSATTPQIGFRNKIGEETAKTIVKGTVVDPKVEEPIFRSGKTGEPITIGTARQWLRRLKGKKRATGKAQDRELTEEEWQQKLKELAGRYSTQEEQEAKKTKLQIEKSIRRHHAKETKNQEWLKKQEAKKTALRIKSEIAERKKKEIQKKRLLRVIVRSVGAGLVVAAIIFLVTRSCEAQQISGPKRTPPTPISGTLYVEPTAIPLTPRLITLPAKPTETPLPTPTETKIPVATPTKAPTLVLVPPTETPKPTPTATATPTVEPTPTVMPIPKTEVIKTPNFDVIYDKATGKCSVVNTNTGSVVDISKASPVPNLVPSQQTGVGVTKDISFTIHPGEAAIIQGWVVDSIGNGVFGVALPDGKIRKITVRISDGRVDIVNAKDAALALCTVFNTAVNSGWAHENLFNLPGEKVN